MKVAIVAFVALRAVWSPTVSFAQGTRDAGAMHVAALRQMAATVNAGDAPGYARLYAAGAEITIFGGASIRGRAAIERYETELMKEYPDARLAFVSVWPQASAMVAHYGVTGHTIAGRSMGHEGLLFFRFDANGLIQEERRYLDSLTPMAQLGAFGDGPARALPVLPSEPALPSRPGARAGGNAEVTARAVVAALESPDASAFLSRISTAIEIDELMFQSPFSGRAGAERWFAAWGSGVQDLRLQVINALSAGDDVLVETMMRGRVAGPLGRLSAASRPFAAHRAFVMRLVDGRVTKLLSFTNGKEIAESSGQWPLRPATRPAVRRGKTAGGIAYDIQGVGPTVVLLTGSNLDRRMWDREAQWLSRTRTVVRYDLRAHGESETVTAPFSHLSDLIGLLDELKIAKATLIGLSAGSTIALDAALEIPDRVERIVLSGPAPSGYVPKQALPFTNDLMAAFKTGDYRKVSEVLLTTPVFAAPPESQALVRRMVTENERMWTVDRSMMKGPPRPAMDRLESVKAPTLVLIGENDRFQDEPAVLLAARIPGARLVRIPGGGHLLNLTSPREFDAAVSAFLGIQSAK